MGDNVNVLNMDDGRSFIIFGFPRLLTDRSPEARCARVQEFRKPMEVLNDQITTRGH